MWNGTCCGLGDDGTQSACSVTFTIAIRSPRMLSARVPVAIELYSVFDCMHSLQLTPACHFLTPVVYLGGFSHAMSLAMQVTAWQSGSHSLHEVADFRLEASSGP